MLTWYEASDRRRARRRLYSLAGNLVFAACALFAIAAAALYVGLRAEGYRFYEVQSGSMEPALKTGAVVGVKQTLPREVAAGDIIAFERQGSVLIHRVNRVQSPPDFRTVIQNAEGQVTREGMTYAPRTFYTKGDANAAQDGFTVPQENLLGVQKFVVPAPFDLLATRLTHGALLALGAASLGLFVIWEVVSLVQERRTRPRSGGAAQHS